MTTKQKYNLKGNFTRKIIKKGVKENKEFIKIDRKDLSFRKLKVILRKCIKVEIIKAMLLKREKKKKL